MIHAQSSAVVVVHPDTQVFFFGLPSPVEVGKGDTFLLVVFDFEAHSLSLDGYRAFHL